MAVLSLVTADICLGWLDVVWSDKTQKRGGGFTVASSLRRMTIHFDPVGAIRELRAIHPDLKVVVFSGHDEGIWLARLIDDLAVSGYVHKSESLVELVHNVLIDAVEHALRGATYYSPHVARRKREMDRAQWDSDDLETLRLLADGYAVAV